MNTVWKNTSNKTVKYATFYWYPYNAVGDVMHCRTRTARRGRAAGGTVTGPIKPGQTDGYGSRWECLWYNSTIKKAYLYEIELEYMDGTSKTIDRHSIKHVYKEQFVPQGI